MSRRKLRQPINFNDYNVIIKFPNGDTQVLTLQEVQEYALANRDLNLCPALFKHGAVNVGSLTYVLTKK